MYLLVYLSFIFPTYKFCENFSMWIIFGPLVPKILPGTYWYSVNVW